VAGIHRNIEAAQNAMGGGYEQEYKPDPSSAAKYEVLFKKYSNLGKLIEDNLIN
jgi:L-ribulokinase